MAFINDDIIELQMIGLAPGGEVRNVWHYRIDAGASPTINATNVAEAWWNHMKGAYRASVPTTLTDFFQRVRCESMMSPVGDAGDFSIPAAEQPGSRTPPTGEMMPQFVACSVRLNVATRTTRPGQKRIFGMFEADSVGNSVSPTFQALALAIATVQLPQIILGAPALGLALIPIVARVPPTLPVVTFQPWQTAQVANLTSSQMTRKLGRGS